MIDMHYDLLTEAYRCYLRNDYTSLEEWCKAYRKDNIVGVVANLYFMSLKEMEDRFGKDYYSVGSSIVDMFRIATSVVLKYLPDIELLFSIEGCDYVEISDLEELYQLGLRSIVLVWNNESKYGSGNRSEKGLTKLGKEFLIRAIDLGIGIDLSHANRKTFDDMIQVIEEQQKKGKQVICYASHSNVRSLCDVERNLTDSQLLKIRNVGGMVGAVSYIPFVDKNSLDIDSAKKKYFDHIRYLVNLLGQNSVLVSTDDMNFCKGFENLNIYSYYDVASTLRNDLFLNGLSYNEINNILYDNAKSRIFDKLSKQ